MQLMQLADAPRFVSGKGDQQQQRAVNFTAVIQQISAGKRAVVGPQKQRVSTYHVLHLADASRSFFKLTCWGEAVPTLSLDDHAPEDIALRVGDIVLFTNCQVKSFRGNIEARFLRASSNVQLLYRKDRYFNTRDVRLKDLYPMIEWYKQHRREFLFTASDSGDGSSTSHSSAGFAADLAHGSSRTKIHNLRENMVTNVVCRLRDLKPSESAAMGANLVLPHGHTHASRAIESTDFDGVLLRELVMQDNVKDWMVANLWDQHAETKFVARLLTHPGVIEIKGIVISLNGLSNRLLANTTPQTRFEFIDVSSKDKDAREVCKQLGINEPNAPVSSTSPAVFGPLGELEDSSGFDDLIVLENLRIEQICVGQRVGSATRVLPQFTQLLVESYCSVCDGVLPELQLNAIPPLYGPCAKRCRVHNGKEERSWRYRRFQMIVRDAHHQRLQLEVEPHGMLELLGNIEAELLIYPHIDDQPPPFNVKCAVASLLNALVDDATQTFRAEIRRDHVDARQLGESMRGSSIDMSQNASQLQNTKVVFTLISLVPSLTQHLAI
ncbi:hypothetical protein FI667_g3879, partial [Globisporangium splendens]